MAISRQKGIIQLQPVRHAAPACEDYGSPEAVMAFERAMRVHRAHSEPFEVRPPAGCVDGTWRVASGSGGVYLVDIPDGSGGSDACTCPDFIENDLGTCKHLEAVRRILCSQPRYVKAFRALPQTPNRPTLAVDPGDGLSLKLLGPWTKALLRRHGLHLEPEQNRVEVREGRSLRTENGDVRILHAVPAALHRQRARAEGRARTEALQHALDTGQVQVDLLKHPLFPYQLDGVAHLLSAGRALLADDMGCGKTVQAIAACEVLRARGEAKRVVVVTMASLKHQWAAEIDRYAGARAVVVGGCGASRAEALASDAPYKVLSYELTWRELPRLQDLDADVLILDEAQRAKNFRTKTATTLRAIPSRFLFVLTGTPVENRLDDLYSLLQLVDPQVLGPLWRFNLDFHQQNPKGRILGCKNLGELRTRIAKVVLRRRKEEVLSQLPPLTEQTRYTALSAPQRDLEQSYRAEAARLAAIAERRPLSPKEQKHLQAALLKARQACNALELCDPRLGQAASPKLDEFEALVSEIAAQGASKILVFSEWKEMLKLAAARLDRLGIGWSLLTGDVPADKRPALLDHFRADAAHQVLLSSDAGGTGLNLQVASYVIHLDLPWNPAKLDQRTARAHRLGQTRGVSVTYLCSEEGIERGIEGTLAGKRAVRSAALDPESQVESVEAQSFTMFMKELREVMEELAGEEPGPGLGDSPEPVAEADGMQRELEPISASPSQAPPEPSTSPMPMPMGRRDLNRLKLARVVLEAGFPGDAVRAAYEAMAVSLTALIEGPAPQGHTALVAHIYRDLLPSGRLASAVPGVLARLHDLTALEAHGVEVDAKLAQEVLEEAEHWVQRLAITP
jgi:superfamily II DNA or RNA helicase